MASSSHRPAAPGALHASCEKQAPSSGLRELENHRCADLLTGHHFLSPVSSHVLV